MSKLQEIAFDARKTLIELALQWLTSQPHVDSIILGASKPEHLQKNIAAAEGRLDEATLRTCDEVWRELRGAHFAYSR